MQRLSDSTPLLALCLLLGAPASLGCASAPAKAPAIPRVAIVTAFGPELAARMMFPQYMRVVGLAGTDKEELKFWFDTDVHMLSVARTVAAGNSAKVVTRFLSRSSEPAVQRR